MKPEEFIADLIEIRGNIILQGQELGYTGRVLENNTTYALIQTLVALFCDKYKVKYEDVVDILRQRDFEKKLKV